MNAPRWLGCALAVTAACGWLGLSATAASASAEPDAEVQRIMFVGDSITGSPGCWRAGVWVALSDEGREVDMVGPRTEDECGGVTDDAGVTWDADNMGIGGITTIKMWVKLAKDEVLPAFQPDVVVQLLGTNDLLGGASVEEILDQYDKLLVLYRDADPSVRVVVGTPPPIEPGKCSGCDVTQAALAEAIPAWAAAASTDASPVVVADLTTGFDVATFTTDGIHPSDDGNAFLAGAWLPAIEQALDSQPSPESEFASPPPSPNTQTGDRPVQADTDPDPTPQLWIPIAVLVAAVIGVGGFLLRRRS